MKDSPLEFPGHHPVKAVGLHTPEFKEQMIAVVHQEVGEPAVMEIRERLSKDHRYLSLTITVHVANRDQLDAIYRNMHATGLLMFAL
jgi:hypothetical protein